jgi:hypothetical protein
MRDNYDFSDSVPNPYASRLKKQVILDLDEGTARYFRDLAKQKGIPYPNLLYLYLKECADSHRDLAINGS